MTRYKGQLRASRTEQKFPHHVYIIVPPGGLGTRLDAMYEFHAQHGIKPHEATARIMPIAHSFDGVLPMRVQPQRLLRNLRHKARPAA